MKQLTTADLPWPDDSELPEALKSHNRHRYNNVKLTLEKIGDKRPYKLPEEVPEEKKKFREFQDELLAKLDRERAQNHKLETGNVKPETVSQSLLNKGVPSSYPSASGNTDCSSSHKLETGNLKPETVSQSLLNKGVSSTCPSASGSTNSVSDHKLETGNSKLETVSKKRYESKDVFIGQNFPVDMARMKLDAENEALKKAQSTVLPGDMARKKLNAQNLALKKELAYALAPTTMKYSTFNDEGLVVAKPDAPSKPTPPPAQPAAPVRDPDNEPSPIPGLLNRHLNYLKFAGMPVPESQRKKFHIPQAHVSSISARKVEFMVNSALNRRKPPR